MNNRQAILISLGLFLLVGICIVWQKYPSQIENKPKPIIEIEEEESDEGGNPRGLIATYKKVSVLVDYAHQLRGVIKVFAEALADIELKFPQESFNPHSVPDPIVIEREIIRWERGRVVLVFCNKNQYTTRQRAAQLLLDGETVVMVFPPFVDPYKQFGITMVPRYIVLEDGNEIYRGVSPPKEN